MKILSAVYSHPDFFPPTLNALHQLVERYEVFSLSRNVSKSTSLSEKIKSYTVGRYMDIRTIEKISTIAKIILFLKYCLKMRQLIVKEKINVVLLYDNIPLFAYWVVQKTFFKRKMLIWYHNHDVLEIDKVRKYSIQWLAGYFEAKIFKKVSLFTLPTILRLKYFNLKKFKGEIIEVPNYPTKLFYSNFEKTRKNDDKIKIVYQGELSKYHGFEELIKVLSNNNIELEFHLIGFINDNYKQELLDLAKENNSGDKLFFYKRVGFNKLPNFTNKYQIGWAVHKPVNVQYQTGSSASNKIYEYIAVGLPVILFDTKHYKEKLSDYDWAHFTNLTEENILKVIEGIVDNYEKISKSAINDFEKKLNFETNFSKVFRFLEDLS